MARKPKSPTPATSFWARAATVAPWVVALVPIVPALLINIEQTSDKSPAWFTLAIVGIFMAAGFTESALRSFRDRERVCGLLFALGAMVAVAANLQNALTNASHVSDGRSDARRSEITASERRTAQLSRLLIRREAQVAIAGEQPPEVLEAAIQQKIAADSRRWRATHQCTPAEITAQASKAFCAELAELKMRLGAARERDEIDRKVEALNSEDQDPVGVPSSVDPMVDRVASVLSLLDIAVDETVRGIIAAYRDWVFAVFAELSAALGPSAVLKWFSPRARPERPPETPEAASQPKQASPPKPTSHPSGDPIVGFIAAKLERCEGASMPSKEMWEAWTNYCREAGAEPGSQKAFTQRLKQWLGHRRKHNRPRWVGVRPKVDDQQKPALRVVSGL